MSAFSQRHLLGIEPLSAADLLTILDLSERFLEIAERPIKEVPTLRESGVERLLLSAGAWDMTHDHMRRESERLLRSGFTSRFLGLGPAGHAFMPSFAQYLPEALRWLRAGEGVGS